MQVDITFRGMTPSLTAEMSVRRWIERLRRSFANIIRCEVVIEQPHHHHQQGNAFHVRIDVVVPDAVISVSRDRGDDAAHADVYVAIADAFRAARRQLQHYAAARHDVKRYATSV